VKLPPSAAKKSLATACARRAGCCLSAAAGPPPPSGRRDLIRVGLRAAAPAAAPSSCCNAPWHAVLGSERGAPHSFSSPPHCVHENHASIHLATQSHCCFPCAVYLLQPLHQPVRPLKVGRPTVLHESRVPGVSHPSTTSLPLQCVLSMLGPLSTCAASTERSQHGGRSGDVGEAGQAGARLVGQALHDDAHVAQGRRNRGAARRRKVPAAPRVALGQVMLCTYMRSLGGIGAACFHPPPSCCLRQTLRSPNQDCT